MYLDPWQRDLACCAYSGGGSCTLFTGIVVIILGALCVQGILSPWTTGWSGVGLWCNPFAVSTLVIPLIGLLGAYGVVTASVVGYTFIGIGTFQILLGSCFFGSGSRILNKPI